MLFNLFTLKQPEDKRRIATKGQALMVVICFGIAKVYATSLGLELDGGLWRYPIYEFDPTRSGESPFERLLPPYLPPDEKNKFLFSPYSTPIDSFPRLKYLHDKVNRIRNI